MSSNLQVHCESCTVCQKFPTALSAFETLNDVCSPLTAVPYSRPVLAIRLCLRHSQQTPWLGCWHEADAFKHMQGLISERPWSVSSALTEQCWDGGAHVASKSPLLLSLAGLIRRLCA